MPPVVNQYGEFEPFKMLIGAIMALVVLTIILGAIDFFGKWTVDISDKKLLTGIRNAVQQPNGKPLEIRNLAFEAGTIYSANSVGRQVGLEPECLHFEGPPNYSSIIVGNSTVQINNRVEANVYAVCYTNKDESGAGFCTSFDCEVCCKIYFAKEPS